jgi:hypothetical protein
MQRMPYHDNRDHLRQQIIETMSWAFPAMGEAGIDAPADLRIASLTGWNYGYNLAAAINWVAQNISPEAADGLAMWISDSLTNGDDDEVNADVMPVVAAARGTQES